MGDYTYTDEFGDYVTVEPVEGGVELFINDQEVGIRIDGRDLDGFVRALESAVYG